MATTPFFYFFFFTLCIFAITLCLTAFVAVDDFNIARLDLFGSHITGTVQTTCIYVTDAICNVPDPYPLNSTPYALAYGGNRYIVKYSDAAGKPQTAEIDGIASVYQVGDHISLRYLTDLGVYGQDQIDGHFIGANALIRWSIIGSELVLIIIVSVREGRRRKREGIEITDNL